MSVLNVPVVFCDECGRSSFRSGDPSTTVAKLIDMAQSNGWIIDRIEEDAGSWIRAVCCAS